MDGTGVDELTRYRMRILAVVAISLFVALVARLWYLQVITTEQAVAVAEQNVTREIRVPAPRGRILDVHGKVLVGNRITTMVTINRRELEQAELDDDRYRQMLTRIAIEVNRSGNELLKTTDIESALGDPAYGLYDDVPVAFDVGEDLLIFFGERAGEYPGVRVLDSTVRSYHYGNLASHLLGWVGPLNDTEFRNRRPPDGKEYALRDEIGKAGIELLFEDDLRGVAGRRVVEVDRLGRIVRERDDLFVAPVPGDEVVLTIDIDLQYLVETELERTIFAARARDPGHDEETGVNRPSFDAPGGAVVVLAPDSGDVLAMASFPSYDPNESIGGFRLAQWEELNDPANDLPMFNRAIQGEYAPGSTFKLFTAHAAWHEGVFGTGRVKPADEPWDDPGHYVLQSCSGTDAEAAEAGGCVFRNAKSKPNAQVDLQRSLTVSSDVYYYTIGESIYINPIHNEVGIQDAAGDYGLGLSSGITLPFEQDGFLPTPTNREQRHLDNPTAFPYGDWYPGDNVNVAIGQGDVLVTPVQLANAFATFANGGTLLSPNVVSSVRPRDGDEVRDFGPRQVGFVDIDPEFHDIVLAGLSGVTSDEAGTAYWAFNSTATGGVYFPLEQVPIAGKTGTAEVRGKADTSLFVAFGPAELPTHAIAAVIEEAGFGSHVAAPLVARLMKAVFTDGIDEAPTAAVRYARSVALPLCVDWYEWITGEDSLGRLEGSDPTADPTSGPVLDADGRVRVRGEVVDCTKLLEDVAEVLDGLAALRGEG
jgi:penicillin-binding protein 2